MKSVTAWLKIDFDDYMRISLLPFIKNECVISLLPIDY